MELLKMSPQLAIDTHIQYTTARSGNIIEQLPLVLYVCTNTPRCVYRYLCILTAMYVTLAATYCTILL